MSSVVLGEVVIIEEIEIFTVDEPMDIVRLLGCLNIEDVDKILDAMRIRRILESLR